MKSAMIAMVALMLVASVTATMHAETKGPFKGKAEPGFQLEVVEPAPGAFKHHITVTVNYAVTGAAAPFQPENDYITVWWEPFAATYTQYQNVTGNSGSLEFTLLNARFPYFFRYYRGDTVMAESAHDLVVPEGSYPMQVHATFVPEFPTSMNIMWVSNRTSGNEGVFFGQDPNALIALARSKKDVTYTHDDLNTAVGLPPIPVRTEPFANLSARDLRCVWGTCYNDFTASELFVDPGVIHTAELLDLQPGTVYYYRVGEIDGHMSELFQLRTRKVSSAEESIQVVYVADAGAGYTTEGYAGSASHNAVPIPPNDTPEGARHVWDAIKRDPLSTNDDAVIMNGDISYARGWPFIWELFHNETEQIFSRAPVMASMGNHEYDYAKNPFYKCRGPDSGGEAGIPTTQRFGFKSNLEPWYWVSTGPITFFALSSEHSISQQAVWLAQELPKVNRTKTPWLIVFLHRPLHESSTFVNEELLNLMQESYDGLFTQYGVDMVLTGHSHYYERMCSVSADACATWNYRDVWTPYKNTALVNSSCATKYPNASSVDKCRVACNNAGSCTGMYLNEDKDCMLIQCPTPYHLTYHEYNTVWSMSRQKGRPPVYVVDGTAGGVFTPLSTPDSPLTVYKDFAHFGYSRINADSTSLTWKHYHIDGSVVDQVTLEPWNTGV